MRACGIAVHLLAGALLVGAGQVAQAQTTYICAANGRSWPQAQPCPEGAMTQQRIVVNPRTDPRLRRADKRCSRLKAEAETLRAANRALKVDLANGAARLAALEQSSALLEKEVHRLDGIRKRTDSSLAQTKALLARLQTVTAHVDMP